MSEETEKNAKIIQEQNTPTNLRPETKKVLVEDTNEFDDSDEYEDEYEDDEYEDDEYEDEFDEQAETDQIKEIAAKGSKKNHSKFAVVKDRFGNIYVEDRRKKIRHKNILYISVGVGVCSLVAASYLGAMLLTKKDTPHKEEPVVIPDLTTREELDNYFDNKVNIVPASATNKPEMMRTIEQLYEEVIVTRNELAALDDAAIIRLGLAVTDFRDKPKNVTFKYKVEETLWTGPGQAQEYELSIWAFIPGPSDTPTSRTSLPIQSKRKVYSIYSSDVNVDNAATTQAKLDEYVASVLLLQVQGANVSSKVWDAPRETNILDAAAQSYYGIQASTPLNKPIDVHLEYTIVKETDSTIGSKMNYTMTVVGKTTAGLTSTNNTQETFATSDNYHTTQTELNDYVESVKEAFTTPSLTYQELDGFAATDELFNQAAISKLKLVGTLPAKPSDVVLTYSFFKRNPPATNGQHQAYILQIYGNVIVTGDADPREVSTENITYMSSNVVHNNSGVVATEFGKFFTAINGSSTIVTTYLEDTINVLPSEGIVQSTDLFTPTYTPSAGITAKFEVKTRTSSSVIVDITLSVGTGVDLATDTKTLTIVYSKLQASESNDAIIAAKSALASLNNTKSTLTNSTFTSLSADKTNYSTRLGISSVSALTNLTAANFTITTSSTLKFTRTVSVVLENTDSTLSLSDRTVNFVLYVADKNELDVADEKSYFESLTTSSSNFTDGTIDELPPLGLGTNFSLILGIGYSISNPFVNVSYEVLTASGSKATVKIIFASKDTSPAVTLEKNLTITYSNINDPVAAATAKLEAANAYLLEQVDATVSTNNLASFTVGATMTQDDYADRLGIYSTKLIDELTSATFKVKSKDVVEESVVIEFTLNMTIAVPNSMSGQFKLFTSDKYEKQVNDEIAAFETTTGITGSTFNENTIATLPSLGSKDDYSTIFTPLAPYAPGEFVNIEYTVENIDAQNSTATLNVRFTHVEATEIFANKTILITYTKLSQASDAVRNVNAVRTALPNGSSIVSTNVWNSFKDLTSVTKTNVASLGLGNEANSALSALTGVTMALVNDPTPNATYKKNVTVTMTMDGFTGDESLLTLSFSLIASDKNTLDFDDEINNFESSVTSENTFDEATITTLPTMATTSLNSIITNTYTPGTKVDVTYAITRVGSVDATLVVTFTSKAHPSTTTTKTINVTYVTIRENFANSDVTSARALLVDKTSTLSNAQIVIADVTFENYWTKLGINKINESPYIEDIQFTVVDNGDYTYRVSYTIVSQFATVSKTGFFTLTASDKESSDDAQVAVDAVHSAIEDGSTITSANNWDSFKDLTTADKTTLAAIGLSTAANSALAAITNVTVGIVPTVGTTYSKDITITMVMDGFVGNNDLLTISFVLVAKDKSELDEIATEIASFRTQTSITGNTFVENTIATLPTTETTAKDEIFTITYTPSANVTVAYEVTRADGISTDVNVIFTSVASPTSSNEISITITYTKVRENLANEDVSAAIALLTDKTSIHNNLSITPGTYDLDDYIIALGIPPISGLSDLEYIEGVEFVVTSNNDYTFNVACTITSAFATTSNKTASFTLTASDKASRDAVDAEKELFKTAIDFDSLTDNTFEELTITTVPDATETVLANIITITYTPTDGINVTYVVTSIDETSVSVTVTFTSATFSQVTTTLTFTVSYTPAP